MYRIFGWIPMVAWCCCSVAWAESPLTAKFAAQSSSRASVLPPMYYETGRPLFSTVSHHTGLGASCGAEGNFSGECCERPGSCFDGIWNDYCSQPRCRLSRCGISRLHRCSTGCASECNSCETNHSCGGCDSCGSTNGCGCSGNRWPFQGCAPCCRPCYRPHCKPIRCWANGWCGETLDGYSTGNPPCPPAASCNCQGGAPMIHAPSEGDMVPSVQPTPAAPPMTPAEAVPTPAKAARNQWISPVSVPRYSRGAVIK
jgi:hypothetical protein